MSTVPVTAPRVPQGIEDCQVATRALTDGLVAAGLAAALVALATPLTAWGPCFDDPGELQTAAAVLGVAHPPGYPGYVLLGHLLCLLPFAEPAALISGANLGAGAICMSLLYLIQRRLEVHPLAALCTTVAVALHDRYWMTITAPEVYAPSLLLLCLAVYGVIRWAHRRAGGWLIGAGLCTGLLLIDRPPEVLSAAVLVLFVVLVARSPARRGDRLAATLGAASTAAALPILIGIAYVMWRDSPGTPYNYLDNYHRRIAPVSDPDSPVPERVQRWFWLATAQQYHDLRVDSWHRLRVRLQYLREEFGYRGPMGFFAGLAVVAGGVIRLLPRNPPVAVLIVGLILGNAAFYCLYVSYGTEAYILPALAGVACLAGVGLTRLFERLRYRPVPVAALLCAAGLCVYFSSDEDWLQSSRYLEARSYLAEARAETLPAGSVIMGPYRRVIPLQYEVLVRLKRRDMEAFAVSSRGVAAEVLRWADRPIYFVDPYGVPPGYELVPEGNLFRVVPPPAPQESHQPSSTDE